MLPKDETWFTEVCEEAGSVVGWKVEKQLAHVETEFQTIDVCLDRLE